MTNYNLEKYGLFGIVLFCLVLKWTTICSWDIEAAQRIGKVQVQKTACMASHIKVDVTSCLEKNLNTTLQV